MKGDNRLLICGSGQLSVELVDFVKMLGKKIIRKTHLIILTGGMKIYKKGVPTVDFTVADSALKELKAIKQIPLQRIVTFLPQRDLKKVTRFRYGDVQIVDQANPKARRFFMVNESDAIISIEGYRATKEIIDLARVLKKPILPIPFTGGASENRWKKYQSEITSQFQLTKTEISSLESKSNDIDKMVDLCIEIIKRRLKPRCFVAMQFENHKFPEAYETIKQIVEGKNFASIRVDKAISSGNILKAIWDLIRSSDFSIVDISGYSPNVFYELGIVHALGKKALIIIYSKSGKIPSHIPFDIKTESILTYKDINSLKHQLTKHI